MSARENVVAFLKAPIANTHADLIFFTAVVFAVGGIADLIIPDPEQQPLKIERAALEELASERKFAEIELPPPPLPMPEITRPTAREKPKLETSEDGRYLFERTAGGTLVRDLNDGCQWLIGNANMLVDLTPGCKGKPKP